MIAADTQRHLGRENYYSRHIELIGCWLVLQIKLWKTNFFLARANLLSLSTRLKCPTQWMLASVIRFILNCKLSGKLQVIYNLNFLPISLLHYWRQFIHSFSCFMEKQHHFSNTEMNSKYLFQYHFEQKYSSNLSKITSSQSLESFSNSTKITKL